VRKPFGASLTKPSRRSSVKRMRQGAPGVNCSPPMKPSLSQRWMVEVAVPRTAAACLNSQQLALGEGSGRLEARDVPLPPQTADMVGGKAVTVSSMTILTVEDTGDDGVWVISGQTANEGDCVLVGAHDCQFLAWQIDIDIGEASTSPPQGEAGAVLGLKHGDDDLFEQRSQQLLAIARRGGRRFPYVLQIGAEREQAAPVFCAECSRSFTFAPGEPGFGLLELAQALLPLALEAAGDETVLGIDSAIAAFGTLCLVPGTFSGEPALGERIVAIGFEPFGGGESGFETRWSKRGENGACNRIVDLHCADAQTKDAATIDDVFCRRSGSQETRCVRCNECAAVARTRRRWPVPAAVRFLLSRHRLSDAVGDGRWRQCATDWPHRSPSR